MKALPRNQESPQWQSRLMEDLSFIKKHQRYPLRKRTLMPVLASGFLLAFLLRIIWVYTLAGTGNGYFFFLIILLVALPTAIGVARYINQVRFFRVSTPFYLSENIKLLQEFLEEQHMITFRHPEAPEVFQIISRNLSAIGDEREIMIFIADNKKILINSHFISSRKLFRGFSAPAHHRQMVRQLSTWLSGRRSPDTALRKRTGLS